MYPSIGRTFIQKINKTHSILPKTSIQQKPRTTPASNGAGASAPGTVALMALPSVTQGVHRLPVVYPIIMMGPFKGSSST